MCPSPKGLSTSDVVVDRPSVRGRCGPGPAFTLFMNGILLWAIARPLCTMELEAGGRGRDGDCSPPPAQTRRRC